MSLRRIWCASIVGMPCPHPHPKTSCLYPLPPFFGLIDHFARLRLRGFAAPSSVACMQLCMHKYKRKMGRSVHETEAPLPSSQSPVFWGMGKGRLSRTPSRYMRSAGRPCPPFPLQRTLKEGSGGGWGGRRMREVRGSAGGAEAPYRVDPHHDHVELEVLVCVYIYRPTQDGKSPSWLKLWCRSPEKKGCRCSHHLE